MIEKFLIKTLLVLGVSTFLIFTLSILLSEVVESRNFANYETESNLLIIPESNNFDILIMGISHARNFSRHKNHLRLEKLLDKKIINIGRGDAKCGLSIQKFYLDYFYNKNNKAKNIIVLLSPPLFYSKYLDLASGTFEDEPFKIEFFFDYLFSNNSKRIQQLFYYVTSKLNHKWFLSYPYSTESQENKLTGINRFAVQHGFKLAYLDGMKDEIIADNLSILKEIIKDANKNNSNIIFIIPPALFGQWPGHDNICTKMEKLKNELNFQFYDFSNSILEPEYYYDHHHLNTEGVEYFTNQFLKPIISRN